VSGSLVILIHTSKTMREDPAPGGATRAPALLDRADELVAYLRTVPVARLATVMAVSRPLAEKTREQFERWSTDPTEQASAVESFLGDIYSGLQAASFTAAQRRYADTHLRILSGLYGILRPYDGIRPYRLEMGYRLPDPRYASLYAFWGRAIADQLPRSGPVVNLAAVEYSRAVVGHLDPARLVTPKFLTADASGQPRFVAVHAKIVRGAFARWLITTRSRGTGPALQAFAELGYAYDPGRSSEREPCFVCPRFDGKGLSVRLS
jgi:cytoplasmic iron level regulating protein YaaA (DUF328/UPF0246 family)